MNNSMSRLIAAINKIYFNNIQINEKDMYESRRISILEGCTARTVVTICGGPFLAGIAGFLGASDQVNGIIGAIPALAVMIMLFSPMILERLSRRKFIVTFSAFFSRIFLSLMFFVPLLLKDSVSSLYLLAAMFLAGNLFVAFITPAASNWVMSITPEPIRGRYFGMRESFVLGFVTIVAFIIGKTLDLYKKLGTERTGFMIIFVTALILTGMNFVLSSSMKEPKVKLVSENLTLRDIFLLPLGNKVFRKVILLFVFWNVGFQFGAPFTAVYMVAGLKLDYTFITICAFLASAASVVGARVLGRLADRKSWLFLMLVCLYFQVASQWSWFFVNHKTALFLIPASQLLGGVALGGVNITLSNIQFQFAPLERKTVYIGFSSAIGGLTGFLSTLLGAAFVGYTENLVLKPWGFEIDNMQLVFAGSGCLLVSCIVFVLMIRNKMGADKVIH